MPADTPQQPTPTALPLKRGTLSGWAAHSYVPSRRGRRHIEHGLSRALLIAKKSMEFGGALVWDLAPELVEIIPEGVTLLVTPPPGKYSEARQWNFARELGIACATLSGIPLAPPMRWSKHGPDGSAKAAVSHRGKARTLGRVAEITGPRLDGQRCAVIDDLFTTGITCEQTAAACIAAGAAEVVGAFTLMRTERTEDRPAEERRRLALKRRQRAARGVRQ